MTEFTDNRPHIEFDPDRIQTWELIELEGQKLTTMALIFARHLANGAGLVSPDLPADPIDELTDEQIAEIKASQAYKTLRRFSAKQLNQAARSFVQGMQNYDPN